MRNTNPTKTDGDIRYVGRVSVSGSTYASVVLLNVIINSLLFVMSQGNYEEKRMG